MTSARPRMCRLGSGCGGHSAYQGAIRRERYEFTLHAIDEMEKDDLFEVDVVRALAAGRLIARLARDPRGTRFVVRGPTDDGQLVEVVRRFPPSGRLRIITAYRLEG